MSNQATTHSKWANTKKTICFEHYQNQTLPLPPWILINKNAMQMIGTMRWNGIWIHIPNLDHLGVRSLQKRHWWLMMIDHRSDRHDIPLSIYPLYHPCTIRSWIGFVVWWIPVRYLESWNGVWRFVCLFVCLFACLFVCLFDFVCL